MIEVLCSLILVIVCSAWAVSTDAVLWVAGGLIVVGAVMALVMGLAMRSHRNTYHIF